MDSEQQSGVKLTLLYSKNNLCWASIKILRVLSDWPSSATNCQPCCLLPSVGSLMTFRSTLQNLLFLAHVTLKLLNFVTNYPTENNSHCTSHSFHWINLHLIRNSLSYSFSLPLSFSAPQSLSTSVPLPTLQFIQNSKQQLQKSPI